MINVEIDGTVQEVQPGELLVDVIERTGQSIPHVCYHPQLGPVQTCDTCMVEAKRPPDSSLRNAGCRWNENLHEISDSLGCAGGGV